MLKEELIEDINNEITYSGMIGLSLPHKELNRIVDIGARYFYDNWRHALQHSYLMIPIEVFRNKLFSQTRRIQLPDCVRFVVEVKEMKNSSIFSTLDRDFSETKFIGSEIFLTPFMGESLVYRTAVFSFLDLTKNLVLETISYDWNKNSKQLAFRGRTPSVNVITEVMKEIEVRDLYDDELFQRYVRAKAKIRMADMIATFGQYQLPGGATIDYQSMKASAQEELTDVKQMIEGEEVPDFMFLERY